MKNLWVPVDRIPLTHIGDEKTQQLNSVNDIQCGGGYSCLDGETCCPTSETSWGCCPSAKVNLFYNFMIVISYMTICLSVTKESDQ